MECKVSSLIVGLFNLSIGIYPEWNVKAHPATENQMPTFIGIYPEWNVKCILPVLRSLYKHIGIYPEWNVKL